MLCSLTVIFQAMFPLQRRKLLNLLRDGAREPPGGSDSGIIRRGYPLHPHDLYPYAGFWRFASQPLSAESMKALECYYSRGPMRLEGFSPLGGSSSTIHVGTEKRFAIVA